MFKKLMGEIKKRYDAETPERFKLLGDFCLIISTGMTGYQIKNNDLDLAFIIMAFGVVGNMLTRLATYKEKKKDESDKPPD